MFHRTKKIISYAMAVLILLSSFPLNIHAAKVRENEEYKAGKTLRPISTTFHLNQIMKWDKNNPDNNLNKASVPLRERFTGHVVNPLANPNARIQSIPLMNSKNDDDNSVNGDEFTSFAFDFWQYLDQMVFWDGPVPTPDVIDAGHRNGVPVYGTLFFNWSMSREDQEILKQFLTSRSEGGKKTYPIADKLIEICEFYGFDGYFINQETYMGESYWAEEMRDFMLYAQRKAKEKGGRIRFSWYDAMGNSGYRLHEDAVTPRNDFFVKKYDEEGREDTNGQYASDEFFMNFNWGPISVDRTVEHMTAIDRDPFDAYAGFELQQNSYGTNIRYDALLDQNKKLKLSLGLYTPDSIRGMASSPEDYHEQERNFWVGFDGDPVTSGDSNSKGRKWRGMARFVADKSVVMSLPFNTYFNTGHGKKWFIDGQVSKDAEWNSRGIQDVLPTWRWWIRSDHTKPLTARYDFDDAYNSGNSVRFEGEIAQNTQNIIKLYSTRLPITKDTKLKVAHRNGEGSKVYIGLATEEDYNDDSFEWFTLNSGQNYWWTTTADVSKLAGKTVHAIALKVVGEEDKSDFRLNLGQIALYNSDAAPSAVTNVKIDEVIFRTSKNAEARLSWTPSEGAEFYEVYQQNADGTKTIVNGTSSHYFYAEKIFRTPDMEGTTQELYVVAVGKNGSKSEPEMVLLNWQMLANDTDELLSRDRNFCLSARVTGKSAENAAEPARNAINGTIDGNTDKWCTSGRSGWMSIEFEQPETVRRVMVFHAAAGGEAVDTNIMNTRDFTIQYKDENGEWKVAHRVQGNTLPVTDANLETPITAKEWKLDITDGDHSPWTAIRIYEWQMFGNPIPTKTPHIPMRWAEVSNTVDDFYQVKFTNVPDKTEVTIAKDKELKEIIGTKKSVKNGDTIVFEDIPLEVDQDGVGKIFYRTMADTMNEPSIVMTAIYRKSGKQLQSIALTKEPSKKVYLYDSRLKVEDGQVTLTYEDGSKRVVALSPAMISGFHPTVAGEQKLHVRYKNLVAPETFTIRVKEQNEPKVASGAAILVEPKNHYIAGEALDLTGGQLTVTFDDSSEEIVDMVSKEVTVLNYNSRQIGVQTLTVSVYGVQTEWNVTVSLPADVNKEKLQQTIAQAKLLIDREIFQRATPEKQNRLKEALDKAVAVEEDVASDSHAVSDAVVELSNAMNELLSTTVELVKVEKEPVKLQYQYGEALDLSGATLELTYGNYAKEVIPMTTEMVAGYDAHKPGLQELKVTYQNLEAGSFQVMVEERPLVKELRQAIAKAEEAKQGEAYKNAIEMTRKALDAILEQAKAAADSNAEEQQIRQIMKELEAAIADLSRKMEDLTPFVPNAPQPKEEEPAAPSAPAPKKDDTVVIEDDTITLSSAEKALVEQLSKDITGKDDKALIEQLVANKVTANEFVQKISDKALMEYAKDVARVFSDEKQENWYAKELSAARMLNLVKGYNDGTFGGNKEVTGKEFVTMLVRMGGLELTEAKGDWFAPYKQAAEKAGLLKDVNFDLDKELTREEVAFLAHNFTFINAKKAWEINKGIHFTDMSMISDQYQKAIAYLVAGDVLKGYQDGSFRPQDAVKRQEIVAILYRLLKK